MAKNKGTGKKKPGRDNFTSTTRANLAKRVNYICSNPGCRAQTSGPHTDPDNATVVGDASHITAAAEGGARYDPSLTSEQRKSAANGIWLCKNCNRLVDNDEDTFPVVLLFEWKRQAEEYAGRAIKRDPAATWATAPPPTTRFLAQPSDPVLAGLEREFGIGLAQALEHWRCGEVTGVETWLRGIRSSQTTWNALSAGSKAHAIRLEARVRLVVHADLTGAQALATEARVLDESAAAVKLDSLLAHYSAGPRAALQVLEPLGLSTTDPELLHFRSAYHLELGESQEALAVLSALSESPSQDAETHRLRALALLGTRDLEAARHEIQKAVRQNPKWIYVQKAQAIILYHSALSPLGRDRVMTGWAQPVDMAVVKQDKISLGRLVKAEKAFRKLAIRSGIHSDEKRHFETWQLACLANQDGRQEEAAEMAGRLLKKDPANASVLAWALTRGYDFDQTTSHSALTGRLSAGTADVLHVLVLASLELDLGNGPQALDLLDRERQRFEATDNGQVWLGWKIRALLAAGRAEGAQATAAEIVDPDQRADAVRVIQLTHVQSGMRTIEVAWAETQDLHTRLAVWRIAFGRGHWAFVADHAQELVQAFQTAEVLFLGAAGAHNAGRPDLCLNLLEKHKDLYDTLPLDIRRARVSSRGALGHVHAARQEAEQLAHEEGTVPSVLMAINYAVSMGDRHGVVELARRLRQNPQLPGPSSLVLAGLVHHEDLELARAFWRQAVQETLPMDAVGQAVELSLQLGLESELARLGPEFQPGPTGPLRTLTWPELRGLVLTEQARIADLTHRYHRGEIPIHLALDLANGSIAQTYHGVPLRFERASAPLQMPSVYIRHGARQMPARDPLTGTKRLCLDITAFLLSYHLGILEAVERTLGPIWVPASLGQVLLTLRDAEGRVQATRRDQLAVLRDLISRGLIRISSHPPMNPTAPHPLPAGLSRELTLTLELALATDGDVVEFLPLHQVDDPETQIQVPPPLTDRLLTTRAVLDGLLERGRLTAAEHGSAVAALGAQGSPGVSTRVPSAGATLYCGASILCLLAGTGVLEPICRHYVVILPAHEHVIVMVDLEGIDQRDQTVTWLTDLMDHVRVGLLDGCLQLLPAPSTPDADAKPPGSLIRALTDLLGGPLQDGDVVWVDDRSINAYEAVGDARVVGIGEILAALRARGALSEDNYYTSLYRLRAANMRWLPVSEDEILYHLLRSSLDQGSVRPTRELSVLQAYVNACLTKAPSLLRPGPGPQVNGELPYLAGLSHGLWSALIATWQQPTSIEHCQTRSDWLVDHLYLGSVELRELADIPTSSTGTRVVWLRDLASLMALSTTINDLGRRQAYMDWLYSRLIGPHRMSDPELMADLASALRTVIDEMILGQAPPEGQAVADHAVRMLLSALPTPVREQIDADHAFISRFGFEPAITLDGLRLPAEEFWRAVVETVNGRSATITTSSAGAPITLISAPRDDGAPGFQYLHPETGQLRIVHDWNLTAWCDDMSRRAEGLLRDQDLFDCPPAELDDMIQAIVTPADPLERAMVLSDRHHRSAVYFYWNLSGGLVVQKAIGLHELLPEHPESLVHFYRLSPRAGLEGEFGIALAAGAGQLANESLLTAIERYVGLPIPLPTPILTALDARTTQERKTLVKQLLATRGSPVSRAHLARLLLRFRNDNSAYVRLARRIVSQSVSARGEVERDTLIALVHWVDRQLTKRVDAREWSRPLRVAMAWGHGHQLLVQMGGDEDFLRRVQQALNSHGAPAWGEELLTFSSGEVSRVFPYRANGLALLVYTLGHMLGDVGEQILDLNMLNSIRDQICRPAGQWWIPQPPVMFESSPDRDALGSFLSGDCSRILLDVLVLPDTFAFSPALAETTISEILGRLGDDQGLLVDWMMLVQVVGDRPIGETHVSRLIPIIQKTQFHQLVEADVAHGLWVFEWCVGQLMWLPNAATAAALGAALIQITETLRDWCERAPSETGTVDPGTAASSLVLNAVGLALVPTDVGERVDRLASTLGEIIDIWPATRPGALMVANSVLRRVSPEIAGSIRRLLVRLRAMEASPI